VVAEHHEHYEELLLHLLVADIREMAIAAFTNGDADLAARIVSVFDEGLREGDERVENAVSVSFAEDTPWYDDERRPFIATWPPALTAEVARQQKRQRTRRPD
jgi:hypothetical protein